jgi:hypothetical protein
MTAVFVTDDGALASTWTWNVTVIVPFGGKVTVPLKAPVAVAELTRLAPVVVAEVTFVTVPRPVGRVSVNGAFVAVLTPVLMITRLNDMVLPATTVDGLAIFVRLRATVGVTARIADADTVLVPTLVVRDPTAMVLVKVPPVLLVTTTV